MASPLPKTETPPEGVTTSPTNAVRPRVADARGRWNPVKVFTDSMIASKIWFTVALLAVIWALVQPFFLIDRLKQTERVVIVDPENTYYVSPLMDFKDANQLHVNQVALAAIAFFDRNPNGSDNEFLLTKMYLKEALDAARALIERDKDEFQGKQLHQKLEITNIQILSTREDVILAQLKGNLVRTGVFNNQSFTEALEVNVSYTMVRNPNLRLNGRFPTAVYAFKIQQT